MKGYTKQGMPNAHLHCPGGPGEERGPWITRSHAVSVPLPGYFILTCYGIGYLFG